MAVSRLHSSKTDDPGCIASATPAVAPIPPRQASQPNNWLPLTLNILLMPALAFAAATWLLSPSLDSPQTPGSALESPAKPENRNGNSEIAHGTGRKKFTAALRGKLQVNIRGTMGTRCLLANITLASLQPALAHLVEANDAELRDLAAEVLAGKTIADLEAPGARNLIRAELIDVFNNVLGEGVVSEIYLTEFAIQ